MTSAKPTHETAKLADFLCFTIYSANLAFTRAYKPVLDELGLTYPQYVTLVALSEQDDLTVGGLGEKLFLETSTLTPLLKRLEAMGLVARRRDPADERQVRVTLTKAGRHLRERGLALRPGLLRATGLTTEDLTRLRKSVAALRDNLIGASPGGVQP